MASETEIKQAIIGPMVQRFKAPQGMANHEEILAEYVEDLRPYGHLQLTQAWKHLRQSHARTTWPLMSEIKEAIKAVALSEARPAQSYPPEDDREKWRKIAKQSPFYAEAMDAGAPLYFLNLIARERRAPRQGDVLKAMQNKDRHVEDVEAAEARAASPATRQAAALGRSIIDKNEDLRREAA